MTETATRLQRLIEERLDSTLLAFVTDRRAEGRSWRSIAEDIEATTRIEVSHTVLRRWFGGQRETAGVQ